MGATRTKPSLVVSSPLSSSHAGGAACAAQKTKSAGEGFSAVESYTILHHFNYPATFDYRYPARV